MENTFEKYLKVIQEGIADPDGFMPDNEEIKKSIKNDEVSYDELKKEFLNLIGYVYRTEGIDTNGAAANIAKKFGYEFKGQSMTLKKSDK